MIKRVFNTQTYSSEKQLREVAQILSSYTEQLDISLNGSLRDRNETTVMLVKLAQIINNPFKLRKEFYENQILPHSLFESLINSVVKKINI